MFCENNFYCKTCFPSFLFENKKLFLKSVTKKTLSTHWIHFLFFIFKIKKMKIKKRVETYLSPQLFLFPQILKFMKVIFKDIRKNCFYIKVSKVYPNQDRAKKFLFYVFKFKKKIVITFYIEKIMVLKYV